jgi:ribonuclease HII
VAGLDEAGRGCLFGPVFAACVVLDPHKPIRGLNDSKLLDVDTRMRLSSRIRETALAWAVSSVDAAEIDRINILQASRRAMKLALEQIVPEPDYLLVDALRLETTIGQEPLIHGDARSRSIAAASILAKVARDQAMEEWDRIFPQYGLASHKGYSTPRHLKALDEFGPTPHHRHTFEPVRLAAGLGQLSLFA